MLKQFILAITLTFLSLSVLSQEKEGKSVKILHAKRLTDGRAKNYQKLVGKVGLQSGDMKLYCDSAEINQVNNDFWAWGHVYVVRDNNVKAYGDSLIYEGESGKGKLQGNVRIIKDDLKIVNNLMYFDDQKEIMYYLTGATITTDSTKIISKKGVYHSSTELMDFTKDVVITHPDYTVYSDTISYNIQQDISKFYGPTNIISGSDKVYCEKGYYNAKNKVFHFVKKARVTSEENIIFADSIYVDNLSEYSYAIKNVHIIDTVNKLDIYGHKAYFNQKASSSYVTDSTLFVQKLDGDTMYLHCDTLKATQVNDVKEFNAFYGVKIFKKDMQGVCDSLSYSLSDSIMKMYYNPIIWNAENQIIGDTIQIITKKNKIDQMYIFNNASIISLSNKELDYYDQVQGTNMIADFKDGKIKVMNVLGNGQTLYYAIEKDSTYTGVNKAICSNLRVGFRDNKIAKIVFLMQPEATFYPLSRFPEEEKKLSRFTWESVLRPKSVADLFN